MPSQNQSQQNTVVKQTSLHLLHVQLGARLVEFAGYSMPVQYPEGIKKEHLHTRHQAGLFDVSHMGQIRIIGANVAEALETLVTGDISNLEEYQQRYTLLTNKNGGIIDDLIVTKIPEGYLLIVNAANKQSDLSYIQSQLELTCRVELMDAHSLLALQGPEAARVLSRFDKEISALKFMRADRFDIDGINCLVSRCGYTGEDGFEISLDDEFAIQLAEALLRNPEVKATGLGARDSLRLEAGLCLHGHDIDASTSPVEAGLSWTIASKYRNGSNVPDFPGAQTIMQQLNEGTGRRRVGLLPQSKQLVREGCILFDSEQKERGRVTSGGFGAHINRPVAMAYVDSDYAGAGTELEVKIRDRLHTIQVADLPFVKHQYIQS